jgi:hypothetical protein
MSHGSVRQRFLSLPLLVVVVLLLGTVTPNEASEGQRFLTNLALLDQLVNEAVEQALDSLGVAEGDSLAILADGYNEGNVLAADAFARSLARRGCAVRILGEVAPAEASGDTTAAGAKGGDNGGGTEGSGSGQGDDEDKDDDSDTQQDQETSDSGGEFTDPFAADSSSVSDSTSWGAPIDSTEVAEEESQEKPAGEAEPDTTEAPVPAVPEVVPSGRVYPSGRVIEFHLVSLRHFVGSSPRGSLRADQGHRGLGWGDSSGCQRAEPSSG